MRIRRLKLTNFRSVATGNVDFPGHTVIIGGNSVGKSTMCGALDLLLGPDRLSRRSPMDEHDFFERRYLGMDGVPTPIELEVVLKRVLRGHPGEFHQGREHPVHHVHAQGDSRRGLAPQVTPQITPQVTRLLSVLEGEMSARQILHALGLSDRKSFR